MHKLREKKEEKVISTPTVLFEDDNVLVIDKPAGWIVNEASTTTNQPVIQTWLAQNYSFPIFSEPESRNGVVHRLDKETSGCLIIAKDYASFENLQSQFKERLIKKTYIALVHGEVTPEEGKIVAEVGRLPWRRDRFGVLAGGRGAETSYEVVDIYKNEKESFSLVKAFPKTGRTHQIRIHFKYLGFPIVADRFYAGRKTSRADRKWCPRLFLHSSAIVFLHPTLKKKVTVESSLPKGLKTVLMSLECVSKKI
jgi:23S rRNA pseudouridine1911/1915/1917 synthase